MHTRTVAEKLGLPDRYSKDNIKCTLPVTSRYVGYEAERENCSPYTVMHLDAALLRCDGDGSLRDGGLEYKFSKPLRGNDVVSAITNLVGAWRATKIPSHSYRTSDHIHIDISDFTEDDIDRLYLNSFYLERSLFNMGRSMFNREHNTYCVPHYKFLQSEDFRRYTGFNCFKLPKYLSFRFSEEYGTIEYRMFESTNSASEILGRIGVCLELVENSKRMDVNKVSVKRFLPSSYRRIKSYLSLNNAEELNTIPGDCGLPVIESNRLSKVYKGIE
jgi:hypothetical protein